MGNMDRGINLGQFLIFVGLIAIALALFFVGIMIASKADDLILAGNTIAQAAI